MHPRFLAFRWLPIVFFLTLLPLPPAMAQDGAWRGAIVRTETFEGIENGTQVSYRREDRWSDLRVLEADEAGSWAYLTARWTVRETRVEVHGDCTYRMEAQGGDEDPTLSFDTGPFDDLSYSLTSTSDTDPPSVTGTMTDACTSSSASYPAVAAILPAHVFSPPAGELPPGAALPATEVGPYGPAAWGAVDPDHPDVLRGATSGQVSGHTVTLAWNLDRSSRCDDGAARAALARDAARLAAAATAPAGPGPEQPPAAGGGSAIPPLGADAPGAGAPLSLASVADAVAAAGAGSEQIALGSAGGTDGAGLRPFALRLDAAGRPLPSLASLERAIEAACVEPGSVEPARTLVIGSVQWAGDDFRIRLRAVDVETGEIRDTSSDSGSGGAAQLEAALRNALASFPAR